jgi:hypothetical protein
MIFALNSSGPVTLVRPTRSCLTLFQTHAQRALRGLIHAFPQARDAGQAQIAPLIRDPLISSLRHAVRVGLSDVRPIPGPRGSTASRPVGSCWSSAVTAKTAASLSPRLPPTGWQGRVGGRRPARCLSWADTPPGDGVDGAVEGPIAALTAVGLVRGEAPSGLASGIEVLVRARIVDGVTSSPRRRRAGSSRLNAASWRGRFSSSAGEACVVAARRAGDAGLGSRSPWFGSDWGHSTIRPWSWESIT